MSISHQSLLLVAYSIVIGNHPRRGLMRCEKSDVILQTTTVGSSALPFLTGNTAEWVLAFKGLKRSQVLWRDPCSSSTLVVYAKIFFVLINILVILWMA